MPNPEESDWPGQQVGDDFGRTTWQWEDSPDVFRVLTGRTFTVKIYNKPPGYSGRSLVRSFSLGSGLSIEGGNLLVMAAFSTDDLAPGIYYYELEEPSAKKTHVAGLWPLAPDGSEL